MTLYVGTTVEEGVWVPVQATRNSIQHSYSRLIVQQDGSWSELQRVSIAPQQRTIWQFILPGDVIPVVKSTFSDPMRAWREACITLPIELDDGYVLADAHWSP